ncbi:hypothetical protein DID75_00295 [Candidatus Marinamargulisbacteria bacterium SCGC AG-410-N11]|nr:hypothetical protein DID75_00295 [Candidatus Marinamargulisbacteria bacterium SCGC AG-410-N11]
MISFEKKKLMEFSSSLSFQRDKEFFHRVWNTKLDVYINRLKAIGFFDKDYVLDAGCGFGQWSVCLSELNKKLVSIEIDSERTNVCKKLFDYLNLKNIDLMQSSIEKLKFKNNTFDVIFCYGVIFLCDYKSALKEFYRVLKPNGKLYFSGAGLGWYIDNLINDHHNTKDFNSFDMAVSCLKNTINFMNDLPFDNSNNKQTIVPSIIMKKLCSEIGFQNIMCDGEGFINLTNMKNVRSFFPKEHFGIESGYEILCEK